MERPGSLQTCPRKGVFTHSLNKLKTNFNLYRFINNKYLYRKIQLDEKTDQHQRNQISARRKEEATLAAREEINSLLQREMALKSEVQEPVRDWKYK